MKEHKKHSQLERPNIEAFSKCDFAFVGTHCNAINLMIRDLKINLSPDHRIITIDANHSNEFAGSKLQIDEQIIHLQTVSSDGEYDQRIRASEYDLALVNGNHYPAKRQIVFLDSNKEASVKKRLHQLDNIIAFVKIDRDEPFSFLKEKMGEKINEIPVFTQYAIEKISAVLKEHLSNQRPELCALILAGGASSRMGRDKSQINLHGESQEIHLAKITQSLGLKTFISKRKHDKKEIDGIQVITDTVLDLGPFGAILTAFQQHRNKAFLVLACDLPLVNKTLIEQLIKHRDTTKFATCVKAKTKSFQEPLISIYEPRAYLRLLSFLGIGYACPRKVLINSDCKIVEVEDENLVLNMNTPEELEKAKEIIDG